MTTLLQRINSTAAAGVAGSVQSVEGSTVLVRDLPAPIGARIEIEAGNTYTVGEVIGFREHETVVGLYGHAPGVQHRSAAKLLATQTSAPAGDHLLGRVLNGIGRPIDQSELPIGVASAPLDRDPPAPLSRPPIETAFPTGVAAIDGLLTVGVGQRVGLFAGSGVGKSVLLGMLARHCQADVIVIGLIGERGREVGEFIQRDLGEDSLQKSVIVVATSDQPAIVRKRAADTATAIAESFRDSGRNVLLLVDSLSRVALAGREIGLAAGEPPAARGFPPSVFAAIPRLVERAGNAATGSITAFYTVLMEDETGDDPISDAVRGLLDGHIMLSRKLAEAGHFPAIDVPASLSRTMPAVTSAEHLVAARTVRKRIADYREKEDLIHIGAYQAGSSPDVDAAIASRDSIAAFAQQQPHQKRDMSDSCDNVQQLSEM